MTSLPGTGTNSWPARVRSSAWKHSHDQEAVVEAVLEWIGDTVRIPAAPAR